MPHSGPVLGQVPQVFLRGSDRKPPTALTVYRIFRYYFWRQGSRNPPTVPSFGKVATQQNLGDISVPRRSVRLVRSIGTKSTNPRIFLGSWVDTTVSSTATATRIIRCTGTRMFPGAEPVPIRYLYSETPARAIFSEYRQASRLLQIPLEHLVN